MNNIVTDTYTLYSDTIELVTEESKENAIIVETPPHETYDIVQNLYARFQFKILGESSNRCLKVKIAQLNKLSCEVSNNKLVYTDFESLEQPDESDIITAIQDAISEEIESLSIQNQYTKASKSSTSNYELMFKAPLIYSGLGFNS